jgi:hypothetical protein
MTFWLLQTLGDVDPDLVERAAQPPRKAHPLRWVAAVAAAAVMMVGVGVWWQHRPEDQPPIMNSDTPVGDTTSTTMNNTVSTPPTTTTTEPPAIGGDEKSCVVHNATYHSIQISSNQVGKELYDAFIDQYMGWGKPLPDPDLTYPFTECNYPESNIVNFVRFCGVTREEFIEYMGWDKLIEEMGEETFLHTRYDNYGSWHMLYTYGDVLDAIYGDDPHLTAWVFNSKASSVADDLAYPYQYCYRLYSYPEDPLYNLEGYTSYKTYKSLSGDSESIIGFVEFAGIPREKFIEVYGWGDKLDEKATDHFEYAPYTYRQFVDAIYGDDQALRDWVFDRYVFSPDYPKAP